MVITLSITMDRGGRKEKDAHVDGGGLSQSKEHSVLVANGAKWSGVCCIQDDPRMEQEHRQSFFIDDVRPPVPPLPCCCCS